MSEHLEDLDSMAESVTRHALAPGVVDEYGLLLCGIDTLDLGLYVTWGANWKKQLRLLDKKKQEARRTGGLIVKLPSGRTCVFRPNSKGENYRFHLQFEAYNLFIAKAARPWISPNVYVSISAKTLWLEGIEKALTWIREDLKAIGGGVVSMLKVSRMDLCCDLWVHGGLSAEFLVKHKVTRVKKEKIFRDKDALETYYVGDAKSPIQLRIYDKGLEITKSRDKHWFLSLWKRESADNIWRVEFQIRRPALKEFGINSIEDLAKKKEGLWAYLTTKWFSLRLADNEKSERRMIHPFWCAVQGCFNGGAPMIERNTISEKAVSLKWYLSHIDGCLSSLAALLGITKRDEAIEELRKRLNQRNDAKDFEEACIRKAIERETLSKGGLC